MTTINEIYDAINPMPAMLSGKGKREPKVTIEFEANAGLIVWLRWKKDYKPSYIGETINECFFGDTYGEAIAKATDHIEKLPSAEDAKLHGFMRDLGNLIDAGKEHGIKVDYLNPLTETMKRISENVLTHQSAEAA